METKKIHIVIKLLPFIGIMSFLIFYIYSTFLYPGGSYADRNAVGFSWMNNYWCNLLEKNALNGTLNPARPFAIASSASLSFGIGVFYYIFPNHFQVRKFWRLTIKILGVTSMSFAIFLFTEKHDFVLNVAGILGIIALIGTLVALYRNNSYRLLWIGIICAFLLAVNNYMYYTTLYIEFLPLIQKISMIMILSWVLGINFEFIRTFK